MAEDFNELLPLSPPVLHILLALAGEDRHGYGIMQEIVRQSAGQYKLWPATLYENLQKLLEQGIVEEISPRIPGDDSRRIYYKLTGLGRGLLSTEIARLERVFLEAKVHLRTRPRRA
jgi:DNA-binding PadR family transcriptional regulator